MWINVNASCCLIEVNMIYQIYCFTLKDGPRVPLHIHSAESFKLLINQEVVR